MPGNIASRAWSLEMLVEIVEWPSVELGGLIKCLLDDISGQPSKFGFHAVPIWLSSNDLAIVALNELCWISDHISGKQWITQ